MYDPFFEPFGDWERQALLLLHQEYSYALRERRLRLRPAAIEICDSTQFWGQWSVETRTIYISRKLLKEQPWYNVLAVLRHEMAHQWVDEAIQPKKQIKPHGDLFKEACRLLGVPQNFSRSRVNLQQDSFDWRDEVRDELAEKMLERVRKLLNLATSSNEHEALLAMNRVREIYAKYNLEKVAGSETEFFHAYISTGRQRLLTSEQKIIGILVGHFFVQVIAGRTYDVKSGKHLRLIEIIGTRENVLMAEYVYHFLRQQIEQLVQSKAQEMSRHGVTDWAKASRASFCLGILQGFDEKLSATQLPSKQEDSVIGTALMAFREDKKLDEYIGTIHPRLSRLTSQARLRDGDAYADGKSVGRKMHLNKPIESATKSVLKFLSGR